MTSKILIVDDEPTVRDVLRRYLEKDGFHVLEAKTGVHALQMIYDDLPDLMILDLMLPGMDGLQIMQTMQETPPPKAIPVIMLTAKTQEEDRIVGFEFGADDYVVKPFSPRELLYRVKAVLRRHQTDHLPIEPPLEIETLRIEPSTRLTTLEGKVLNLTAKEFDLLLFLARHPRQVFTRVQLLDQVWGYEFFGDESTVTVHMHRLREKLEPNPSQPMFIHTVWGVGYKFEFIPT